MRTPKDPHRKGAKRPAWAIPPRQVEVFAPATVANVGPGFDVLGLALEAPGDTVVARRGARPGVTLLPIAGPGSVLPLDPTRNTAGIAAAAVLRLLAARGMPGQGVELALTKGIPLASGMGSSAASAAAGALAVASLWPGTFELADLLEPCLEAEAAVSGRHADNLAAALFGGLVIVTSVDPVAVRPVRPRLRPWLVLVKPDFGLATAKARKALPRRVPLGDAVHNLGAVAALVHALLVGDLCGFAAAVRDRIAEPARRGLIPGFEPVAAAARAAGALAVSISGAGPSLFAVVDGRATGARVGAAMVAAWEGAGHQARAWVSRLSLRGARRVDR